MNGELKLHQLGDHNEELAFGVTFSLWHAGGWLKGRDSSSRKHKRTRRQNLSKTRYALSFLIICSYLFFQNCKSRDQMMYIQINLIRKISRMTQYHYQAQLLWLVCFSLPESLGLILGGHFSGVWSWVLLWQVLMMWTLTSRYKISWPTCRPTRHRSDASCNRKRLTTFNIWHCLIIQRL